MLRATSSTECCMKDEGEEEGGREGEGRGEGRGEGCGRVAARSSVREWRTVHGARRAAPESESTEARRHARLRHRPPSKNTEDYMVGVSIR